MKKRITAFLIAALAALSIAAPAFAESSAERLSDESKRLFIISNGGDTTSEPKNSYEAIESALIQGADAVALSLKETSDGFLVVMDDDTTDRTLVRNNDLESVDEPVTGGADPDEIANISLAQLQTRYFMRSGKGGKFADTTDRFICAFDEVLELVKKYYSDRMLIIRHAGGVFEKAKEYAEKQNMLGSVAFLFDDVPFEEASGIIAANEGIHAIAYFKGNIIFSAVSRVNKAAQAGCDAIMNASRVPYGVVFTKYVTGKAASGGMRALIDMTDPSLCGKIREDTARWWDEVIDRGFNAIITDDVAGLVKYVSDCDASRTALTQLRVKYVDSFSFPEIGGDKYLDYKHAYDSAVRLTEEALADGSAALSTLDKARYELKKAVDDAGRDYDELVEGTAGKTVTAGRIIAAALAVAGVVALELFVYKKKAKKGSVKK